MFIITTYYYYLLSIINYYNIISGNLNDLGEVSGSVIVHRDGPIKDIS